MSKTNEVTGTLTGTHRRNSSANGNPNFDIILDGAEIYRTSNDASVGYEVTNFRIGSTVRLTLTKAGRVTNMNYVGGDK